MNARRYGDGLTAATADITDVVNASQASGDAHVQLFNFGQQNSSLGTGCDYHPNVTMAAALVAKIKAALGW